MSTESAVRDAGDDVGFSTPRPRLGPLGALTTLRDFAIVTYDVDPDRLMGLLPAGYQFEPELVMLDNGRRRGLISAVNFRDVDFRFRSAKLVRASFVQTNYRAYVRRGDERAVWFFGTSLGSRLSIVPRRLWGMPWFRVAATLDARWSGQTCLTYDSRSTGSWGSCSLHLDGTDRLAGRLDGFADADAAALVLTHPLVGYFAHQRGGVGRYAVWHERLRPTVGRAIDARFDVFEHLGLIEPGQEPHSVLLQPATDFVVVLPPTRVTPTPAVRAGER